MIDTSRQINIPYLLKIGPQKMAKVGKYLFDKKMNTVAIFQGSGIDSITNDLYKSLEEFKINIIHKEIINSIEIEQIVKTTFNLPKIDAILGIGGGRAVDFAKYSAHLLHLPFISIPTSVANDGFCSPSTSLLVQGKRKSIKSGIPFGVVIDLDIIKNSPPIFIYSGIGDMVSKITALYDWKEAFNKGLERFNDFASLLAYNSLDLLFLKYSSNIFETEFIRGLVNSLLTSGLAMEVAGTSRPASGAEHLISHALDNISKNPKIHGIQVGISTYLVALLQNNPNTNDIKSILTSTGLIDLVRKDPLSKSEYIEALKLAPSIKENYYTILSRNGILEKALYFIQNDELLRTTII